MKSRFGKQAIGSMFGACAIISAIPATFAIAAPPSRQVNQVPGYYRMQLGEFEVTALYDGRISIDSKLLKGIDLQAAQRQLARMFVPAENGAQTAVNAYLVNTGSNLVLVDAGAASCFGPTLGALSDNLRAAGYEPAQVDTVLLTHLHGDHICGLAEDDGKPVFPNATVHVAREEAAFWLDPASASETPDALRPFIRMARESVAPYASSGRLKTFGAGSTILPGVVAKASDGHTPGHSGFLFTSEGQHLLVWGDIVHSHAIQFARPQVSIEFDVDQKQAVATRRKVFQEAADKKLWIAGAHLPFPGIGHVRKDKRGFAWVPAEFAPLPTR